MIKKIKVEDLPTFDPAEHLKDDADIAAYLSLVIDEGDAGELAHASRNSSKSTWHGTHCRRNRHRP
jgi:DNA-binding phage protein